MSATTHKQQVEQQHHRLLFASCNSQHYEQVLWPAILDRNASAFVWGGDAIYGDDFTTPALYAQDVVQDATPKQLQSLYHAQRQHPGYQTLIQSGIPIFGVLDDHDYGRNDGDSTFTYRQESGILFACDFLQWAAACTRARNVQGVYGVQVMDFDRPKQEQVLSEKEAGLDPDYYHTASSSPPQLGKKTVAMFLLDVRSNKTPYTKTMGPEEEGDFLGEIQWKWLEEALARSTAAVNIVVQGIQVHADRQGPVETWSRFPTAQQRLYQALLQANVKAPILISGDVHHAQLLRKDCHTAATDGAAQHDATLLEVTTSGMTHAWASHTCARPHQSSLCTMAWSQWMAHKTMELVQYINGKWVWTEVVDLDHSQVLHTNGRPGLQYALERNFAELEFDFENKNKQAVTVRILGKELGARPLLHHTWSLEELSGNKSQAGPWTCENYRGTPHPSLRIVGVLLPLCLVLSMLCCPPFLAVLALLRFSRRRRNRRLTKTKHA